MIATTLKSWTEIFRNRGIDDPEHDPARIAIAFAKIAGDVVNWPAPKQVLDAMPEKPRPYFHKLPAPELTDEEAEAQRQQRADIVKRMGEQLAERLRGES